MNDDTNYVYVISASNDAGLPVSPVKVGMSKAPRKRIASLRTASPNKLMLVSMFPLPNRDVAASIEWHFHELMGDYRMHGEWFDLCAIDATIVVCAVIRAQVRDFMGHLTSQQVRNLLSNCGVLDHEELCSRVAPETVAIFRGAFQ